MVDREHDVAPYSCARVIQIFTWEVVREGLRDGWVSWRCWIIESYHPWACHWNVSWVSHCLGRTLAIIIFLLAISEVPGRIVRVFEKVWCLPISSDFVRKCPDAVWPIDYGGVSHRNHQTLSLNQRNQNEVCKDNHLLNNQISHI